MDAKTFYDLQPTDDPARWQLPVVPTLCTGGGFLFGGCGLGACIAAMELVTDRPLVWATGQFLSYANPPSLMDIDVTIAADGRSITQARAVARVGGREILTVNAALGKRSFPHDGQWATMPTDVPGPGDCAPRQSPFPVEGTIMERLDQRLALGRHFAEDADAEPAAGESFGRSALWTRMPELLEMSAGSLAILGDYVPMGIWQALGKPTMSNSLDNTLRVIRLVPTEWVLLEIEADAVHQGFGHGTVHLWAEDGTLMATASQSSIVRHRPTGA